MAAIDINNSIKEYRLNRFKEQIEAIWDVDDILFNVCFLFVIGASDNIAKNFYPYTMGGKWRLRNDDLDTIKPTDNQGADRKPYYIEWYDKDSSGNYYVNAAEGGFIKLIWDAYFTGSGSRGYTMMNRVLQGLESLGGSSVGLHLDRLMAWNEKYYNSVKEYFPAALINDDMMRYERARIAANKGLYSEVDPLTQELGDHKSTENSWMKKRFIYLQSMFSYGDFSAGASGTITFRLLSPATFTLKPAIAMYPSIAAGSTVIRGARTMAGAECSLYISGSDLDCSILGAHYLSDIGDWHNMPIRNNPSFNAKMLKELILGVPNASDPISLDITGVTLNCPSLNKLDVRNIRNLTGQLDLTGSAIINTVLSEGTQISRINFANGSPLVSLNLPTNYQQLVLRDAPVLTAEGINYMDCAENITRYLVSNCANLNAIKMLSDIIAVQESQGDNHALQRVYVDDFYERVYDTSVIENLAMLTTGYQAMNRQEQDIAGVPILSGTIVMMEPAYPDSVESLLETFGPGGLNIVKGEGIDWYIRFEDIRVQEICCYNWGDVREVTDEVATGVIEADDNALVYSDYVFASCLVAPARILADGTSFSQVDAAARNFKVEIEFDDADPFDGIVTGTTVIQVIQYGSNTDTTTTLLEMAVENVALVDGKYIGTFSTTNTCQYLCIAVLAKEGVRASWRLAMNDSSIYQPVGITQAQCAAVSSLGTQFKGNKIISNFDEFELFTNQTFVTVGSFESCTELTSIIIPNSLKTFDVGAFNGCIKLVKMNIPNGCELINTNVFARNQFETLVIPDSVTTIGGGAFQRNTSLRTLVLPTGITSILGNICFNCSSLQNITIPSGVTSIGVGAFNGCAFTELTIPAAVTSIENEAFADERNLEWIKVLPATPPTIGTNVFVSSTCPIYVPDESVSEYKAANNWSSYSSRIKSLNEFTA